MEFLSYPFIQNAILAAALASIACGVVGALVISNRMTFLAGGVAHAAYGGVGLAFALGLPVVLCTIGFSLVASLVMGIIILRGEAESSSGPGSTDTAVGVLWAAGMAFGIILIDLTPGYASELMSFLFGSILSVPATDLYIMLGFDLILLAVFSHFRQGITIISLDTGFARVRGVPVTFFYLLMVGMIAVTVVILIRIVGLIMVIALLTIPPYIARLFSNSLTISMILGAVLSFLFCIGGLIISYYIDISAGAVIIMLSALGYFGAVVVRKLR